MAAATLIPIFFLSGCATQMDPGGDAPPLTLASTPALPVKAIEHFYPPAKWEKLRAAPYLAFVVATGEVFDGRFKLEHLIQSFPDHSYDALAESLLQRVTLKASTVGTHITPTASAWVILYPRSEDGALALIYARQTNFAETSDAVAAQFFSAQHW